MSVLALTLYTGRLAGKPLRFFRAPQQGTQLPWHAWEDLQLCLSLEDDVRVYMRRCLMTDWSKDVRTVPTADGIVTIAPHWMAQGVVGAIGEIRGTEPALTIAYQQQMFEAWAVLTGDMPAGDSMELLGIAVCNMLAERSAL